MCEAHDHKDLSINPATNGGEAELTQHYTQLTKNIVSGISTFSSYTIKFEEWNEYGDEAIVFKNSKGNFELIQNNKGFWDIYYDLLTYPRLIKKSLKYLEELKALYEILLNESITYTTNGGNTP